MKDIIEVRTIPAHWDSGQPDSYLAVTWDFQKMEPKQSPCDAYTTVDPQANALAVECYKIYKHNQAVSSSHRYRALETADPEKRYVGDVIMVKRGQLAPRGTIGEIVSVLQTNWGAKFTIRDAKHEYKVYAKNCEVLAIAYTPHHREVLKPYPSVTELERVIYNRGQ